MHQHSVKGCDVMCLCVCVCVAKAVVLRFLIVSRVQILCDQRVDTSFIFCHLALPRCQAYLEFSGARLHVDLHSLALLSFL